MLKNTFKIDQIARDVSKYWTKVGFPFTNTKCNYSSFTGNINTYLSRWLLKKPTFGIIWCLMSKVITLHNNLEKKLTLISYTILNTIKHIIIFYWKSAKFFHKFQCYFGTSQNVLRRWLKNTLVILLNSLFSQFCF